MLFPDEADIIDEVLTLFRANCFFRNFELKGGADRLLVYLTLYTTQCLRNIEKHKYKTREAADKGLHTLAVENFVSPGDSGWKISGVIPACSNRREKGKLLDCKMPSQTPSPRSSSANPKPTYLRAFYFTTNESIKCR